MLITVRYILPIFDSCYRVFESEIIFRYIGEWLSWSHGSNVSWLLLRAEFM